MRRMPFEPPTDYYDEKVLSIDEQICALMKKRKEISNSNPGYPTGHYISTWAKKYELYEDQVRSIFSTLLDEEFFRPYVEPKGFIKHLPVLKIAEKDSRLFTVPFIKQYENASVVHFTIDWDETVFEEGERPHFYSYELFIGEEYDCRSFGGGGSTGHSSLSFVVSPPFPNNISGLTLKFTEYNSHYRGKPTGVEIVMNIE